MNIPDFRTILVITVLACVASCSGAGSRAVVPDSGGGLMWQGSDGGEMPWKQAHLYCLNLSLDGRDDWRLPSLQELERAYNIKAEFPSAFSGSYWSSESGGRFNAGYLKFDFGLRGFRNRTHPAYVRCVRQLD